MLEDERIDQVYDEFERKTEPTKTDFIKRIPNNVKMVLGIAGVFLIWQMFVGGQNLKNILILFLLAIGLLWLISQGASGKILTEQELKVALFKKLKWKQSNPLGGFYEIPEGQIKVGPACNLLTVDGKPWRWPMMYRIEHQSGLEKMYVADMDPFTGNILAIVETDRGFKGDERPHVRWILTPQAREQQKYYKEVGRTPRRQY